MAAKSSNWLLGCGLGCAVLVLISLGLGFLGAHFVRQTTAGFDQAIETRAILDQRFGPTAAFVPAPDGAVAPERMEVFLAVREATAPARERLAGSWREIPMSPAAAREIESQGGGEKLRSIFRITRSSLSLGGEMGRLYEARNRALLDAGLGLGEYTYVYAMAYHAWLGHSPGDGPENAGDAGDGAAFGPRMGDFMVERLRADLLQMLRHQAAALPDGVDEAWRQALAEEIAAVESDRRRLPWQEGLPAAIADSFEPYRARLEATYDPVTNAFELGRNKRQGRYSIGLE